MQKPSVSSSGAWVKSLPDIRLIAVFFALVSGAFVMGCSGPGEETIGSSWNLSSDGSIRFTFPEVKVQESVTEKNANLTVTDLMFKGFAGDVHAILVSPKKPNAFLIWAPGANNPASGYLDYMKYYPAHDIAVLIMDVRGNGGLTPGYPMDIERDAGLFVKGEWPQWYLIAADMISAQQYIHRIFPSVPVYAVGDSNGGRYAALAAGSDPGFAGYMGISTSGFSHIGDQYSSPVREFLLSIDPEVQVPEIIPRPVMIFHAPEDPVIPFEDGRALAGAAGDKAIFISFNGTHGGNREVDDHIITFLQNS
ncbi:alpha/beta hydrolase [Methanospirillum stamsii]|uniref:Alpha/beta hydrolase n=1 Tax=Methanospirillum stamsii TaxID=1277351 RepID=A0A2V2NAQ8_9EURY|nr:alpha/beta hydrolase [Methanospirillum stamsii]